MRVEAARGQSGYGETFHSAHSAQELWTERGWRVWSALSRRKSTVCFSHANLHCKCLELEASDFVQLPKICVWRAAMHHAALPAHEMVQCDGLEWPRPGPRCCWFQPIYWCTAVVCCCPWHPAVCHMHTRTQTQLFLGIVVMNLRVSG